MRRMLAQYEHVRAIRSFSAAGTTPFFSCFTQGIMTDLANFPGKILRNQTRNARTAARDLPSMWFDNFSSVLVPHFVVIPTTAGQF